MRINDLPAEMIEEIMSDSIYYFPIPIVGSRHMMGVCRSWHDIITSAPKFWTDVWIRVDIESRPAHFDWILWRLAVQLARSKRALIDVTWQVRISELQLRHLMQILGEYTSFDRWRSLHVVHHRGGVPDIGTLSPLGMFRSLETLRIQTSPPDWLLGYIDSTLPPSALLRELECYSLDFLLHTSLGAPSIILQTISKLDARYILSALSPASAWIGLLPTNITDLTLEYLDFTAELDLSHVKKLNIKHRVTAGGLSLYAFPALTTLDIAFNDGLSKRRLAFPVLLELRIRGEHYHTLSNIDAPRLQVLVVDRGNRWTHRRARPSLEHVVELPQYALQPTRELDIGFIVSPQALQALLDCSPSLEGLTLCMAGQAYDREVLRRLLFPWASPEDERDEAEDEGDETSDELEDEGEVEWRTLRHGILLLGEGHVVEKPRGQNLRSLTIHFDSILRDEDLATWERCLREFEDAAKPGSGREPNRRFRCVREVS